MSASATTPKIEQLTQELGHAIFERIEGSQPGPWQPAWWNERLMERFMRDEWLKVQAFRFIDALPTMQGLDDVARHLREYFVHPAYARPNGGAKPAPTRRQAQAAALAELEPRGDERLLRWLSDAMNFERVDGLWARGLAWAAQQSSVRMAHRFIAGTNLAEAERTIRRMRERGLAFTVDVLGEAALSERESEEYQRIYMELLTELPRRAEHWPAAPQDFGSGRPVPRVNVSVKLTSLYSQSDAIDPAGTKRGILERLRPLLREGMARGAHVHIDMEHYAIKDLTLDLCREVFCEPEFRDYPHFGVVLQAYLREAERDARDMVDWARRRGTPIWIRLVKGAYWDTETVLADQHHWPCPVWRQKWQSDACYERVTRILLEAHAHTHVAFGSHNVRSLAHAMALKRVLEVPGDRFELQMLYGMGDPLKTAGVSLGERVRVYTPYGQLLPGMAYLIRRLLENTANESFLRVSVDENTPRDALLRDPEAVGRETPPPPERVVLKYEFEDLIMDPFENVPNVDYTREDNRRRMSDAIADLRRRLPLACKPVVDGERFESQSRVASINPSKPSEVVGWVHEADAALTEKAIEAARRAFGFWRRVAPAERAGYLFRAAEIMERRRFELCALEALECGKPWREADADISEAIDFCNFYGKEMIRLTDHMRRRDIPGETNEYFYTPRGVVGVIAPWNFPLAILTGMAVAGLVTGNAVIIKPAEQASAIARELMEIFDEAGLPAGVLNYVPGPGRVVGETLVRSPHVAMIAFTGSREVGCRINRTAAELLTAQPGIKRIVAEMGGKNATIVDVDADMDEAVKGVLYAAFGYAGQKCSASSRCIVLAPIYDRFIERLTEAARSVQVGPADDCGTFVPPVIDGAAFAKIREYIAIGKTEGRCVLDGDSAEAVVALRRNTAAGGDSGGFYIGPTIFADIAPKARIAQEEIFGPVLAVIKARDIEHAIEILNGTDYALTGGIFSRSPAHIAKARRECEVGNFYINRKITGALVDLQPFGGFKMSGLGSKAGGPDYLMQFCEPRCVTENTLRRGFAPSEQVAEIVSEQSVAGG